MASIEEHLQTVQFFPESNSADSVHASKRGIKNHCRDAFQCGRLAVWLSPRRSRSHELCVATILGWQKKNTVLSGFVGKEDRQDEDFGMRTTNEHWNPWNEKCWKPCGHTEEERLCGRQTSTKTRRRPRADYAERHNRQDEDFGIHVTAKDRYFSCL